MSANNNNNTEQQGQKSEPFFVLPADRSLPRVVDFNNPETYEDAGNIDEAGIDGDTDAPNFALKRWNICMECDRLFKPTRQCKECGCFMKIKVRIRRVSCPLGKW